MFDGDIVIFAAARREHGSGSGNGNGNGNGNGKGNGKGSSRRVDWLRDVAGDISAY